MCFFFTKCLLCYCLDKFVYFLWQTEGQTTSINPWLGDLIFLDLVWLFLYLLWTDDLDLEANCLHKLDKTEKLNDLLIFDVQFASLRIFLIIASNQNWLLHFAVRKETISKNLNVTKNMVTLNRRKEWRVGFKSALKNKQRCILLNNNHFKLLQISDVIVIVTKISFISLNFNYCNYKYDTLIT